MKKIVTLGGGTGQYTLLSGLKKYPIDITAIVSMADDGGSTGILRDELGVLPPGDIRKCLVALSEDTDVLRNLFSYRFTAEEGKVSALQDHAFGNLFLAALEKVTGSFETAIIEASRILRLRGTVLPSTLDPVTLVVTLMNNEVLIGESVLDNHESVKTVGVQSVRLQSPVRAYTKAIEAIEGADFIIIGPGDLFGSIIPCLLVEGIANAIRKCSARVVYIANLSNKRGVTQNFTISSYINHIEQYIGNGRITTTIGNSQLPSLEKIETYEQQYGDGSIVVCFSGEKHVVCAPLISDNEQSEFVRHDPKKLAEAVMKYVQHNK